MSDNKDLGKLISPFRPIKYKLGNESKAKFINRQMDLFKRTAKDVYQFKVFKGNDGDFPKEREEASGFGTVCRELEELLYSHYSEPMETEIEVPIDSLFFRILKLYHTFRVYIPPRVRPNHETNSKHCITIALNRIKEQNANLYLNGVAPLLSNLLFLARATKQITDSKQLLSPVNHNAYGTKKGRKRDEDFEHNLLELQTICLEILTLLRFSHE